MHADRGVIISRLFTHTTIKGLGQGVWNEILKACAHCMVTLTKITFNNYGFNIRSTLVTSKSGAGQVRLWRYCVQLTPLRLGRRLPKMKERDRRRSLTREGTARERGGEITLEREREENAMRWVHRWPRQSTSMGDEYCYAASMA